MNDDLRSALSAVSGNRLRSFLTILGIVIGISTMTAVTSVLQGFTGEVNSTFEEMGTTTIYIAKSRGPGRRGADARELNTRADLEIRYAEELSQVRGVSAAVPYAMTMTGVKTPDGVDMFAGVAGTGHLWPDVSGRSLTEGRFFTEYEVSAGTKVCLLGSSISERLFGDLSPVGEELVIDGSTVTVIGVLEEVGEIMGMDRDNIIIVPWTIFSRWASLEENLAIMVLADSPEDMEGTIERVENTMRSIRRLSLEEENDFEIMSTDELMSGFSEVSGWLFVALIGLSAISLFVGSVGIANIMLVSVTQRTGEIGLRKALGATRKAVLKQFVTESVILALAGGLLGILAGALLAEILSVLTDLTAGLSPLGITAGVVVSMLSGVLAGLYPAARAASMQPVAALSKSV